MVVKALWGQKAKPQNRDEGDNDKFDNYLLKASYVKRCVCVSVCVLQI